jgi:uncharacterized protein
MNSHWSPLKVEAYVNIAPDNPVRKYAWENTMQLEREPVNASYQIRAYAAQSITVNDQTLSHSLIITPQKLITEWPVAHIQQLRAEHIDMLLPLHPEILLIGTGQQLHFPEAALLAPLLKQHIGYEIMDTGAACRTYNILAAEQRAVAAALIVSEKEV